MQGWHNMIDNTVFNDGCKLYESDDINNNSIEVQICTIYNKGFRFTIEHLIYTDCDNMNFFTVWQFNGIKCIAHKNRDAFTECTDFIKTIEG